jgi:hypothetical protein
MYILIVSCRKHHFCVKGPRQNHIVLKLCVYIRTYIHTYIPGAALLSFASCTRCGNNVFKVFFFSHLELDRGKNFVFEVAANNHEWYGHGQTKCSWQRKAADKTGRVVQRRLREKGKKNGLKSIVSSGKHECPLAVRQWTFWQRSACCSYVRTYYATKSWAHCVCVHAHSAQVRHSLSRSCLFSLAYLSLVRGRVHQSFFEMRACLWWIDNSVQA